MAEIDAHARSDVPQQKGTAANVAPEITEYYGDYVPPVDVKQTVTDLLEAVPPPYLAGLKRILLTDRSAVPRDQRRQKMWSRKRRIQLTDAGGLYYEATRSRPATVWIFVDNVLQPFPRFMLRMPLMRYVAVASTLYHEVGHHIHAVHRPVYDGKENMAEDWRRKLGRRFFRRRYWYLVPFGPFFRVAAKLLEAIQSRRVRRAVTH